MHHSLSLRCDAAALVANYRNLKERSGTHCGAAIKADGYGLGALDVANRLAGEGCRDFFVSTWSEATELSDLPEGSLAILHGFGPDDVVIPGVRPVLVSAEQVARWKQSSHAAEPCDVMVDTGMNRLGLAIEELDLLGGLNLHTLHSHLACADEDHPLNALQLERFRSLRGSIAAKRYSLANSAGILLGKEYGFDLVRPGLGLYGGVPRAEGHGRLRRVATPSAQIIQLRSVAAGSTVGYNATFTAPRDLTAAVINIGYADGYWRAFSSCGTARFRDRVMPVIGRVSMDLVTLDATDAREVREGDWVDLDFDLPEAAKLTGYSQYELLTGLGHRFQRSWS